MPIIFIEQQQILMIVDRLPKNGLIQKGQYLSLQFFEHQITTNLANISQRIHDLIDYQGKKKGIRKNTRTVQQYIEEMYEKYTLDYATGLPVQQSEHSHQKNVKKRINNVQDLEIIDAKFLSQYPIFYQPKWRIFYNGHPTIRELAMLNHLAFGYFYKSVRADDKKIRQFDYKVQCFLMKDQNSHQKQKQLNQSSIIKTEQKIQQQSLKKQLKKGEIESYLSTAKLVAFLQQIPNFDLHLSKQQKQVIEDKSNIIVIGRSGTGKTTCALLRLFSIETYCKVRQKGPKSFTSKDIETGSLMKNILLTVSPFLIVQLKRSYSDYIANIKLELEKKQQAKQGNNLKKQIKQEEQITDLRQLDKKINIKPPDSLNDLTPIDYPGFFTLKNFLVMLDATFKEPFFCKNPNFIINQEEINFGHKAKLWIKLENGQIRETQQINYEYFRDIFWQTQKKKTKLMKNLTPIVVWSEIFSTIQGSTQAHRSPLYCISEQMYVNSSKNKALTEEEKREIYFIFEIYRKWKKYLCRFDLMDLVNYLLIKIEHNPNITFNNIFIDEVQDMTAAAIYLISQLASNKIFYAGDTAQSISKGVIFKFSDIKLMYRNQSFSKISNKQQPKIASLTVNFRSQNSILLVANTLIRILQLLFPKSIDTLRKQSSDDHGPKPVIAGSYLQIKDILTNSPEQTLSIRQAVIVRTVEIKEEVQKLFGNVLVLTVEECKGLEFQDVVVWGFLQNWKIQKLWRIIEMVEIDLNAKRQKAYVDIEFQQGMELDKVDDILSLSNKIKQHDPKDYDELCSELKLLYTATTRAKQTLTFYNSISPKLQKILTHLNLIQNYSQQYVKFVKERRKKKKQSKSNQIDSRNTNMKQWKNSGISFYLRDDYEMALICFRNTNETKICKQLLGKIKVRNGQRLIQRMMVKQELQKEGIGQYDKDYFIQIEQEIKKAFLEAAQYFSQSQFYQDAGKAYYMAKSFRKAIEQFRKVKMHSQIAKCYIELKQFSQAAQAYENAQKYEKAIECLVKGKKQLSCLVKLCEYRDKIANYIKRKDQMKDKILKDVQKQIANVLKDKKYRNQNLKIWDLDMIENSSQNEQQQQQQNNEYDEYNQKMHFQSNNFQDQNKYLIKNQHKIEQSLIQNLNITIFSDKLTKNNLTFKQFDSKPININNLLKQLSTIQKYNICYIICAICQNYYQFQQYFVANLWRNYDNRHQILNYVEQQTKDSQLRSTFSKGIKQNQIKQVRILIGSINLDMLKYIEDHVNPKIIVNLRQNLVLCGFYQQGLKFFNKQWHQYKYNHLQSQQIGLSKQHCRIFQKQHEFLQQINQSCQLQSKYQSICSRWHLHSKSQSQLHSHSITFSHPSMIQTFPTFQSFNSLSLSLNHNHNPDPKIHNFQQNYNIEQQQQPKYYKFVHNPNWHTKFNHQQLTYILYLMHKQYMLKLYQQQQQQHNNQYFYVDIQIQQKLNKIIDQKMYRIDRQLRQLDSVLLQKQKQLYTIQDNYKRRCVEQEQKIIKKLIQNHKNNVISINGRIKSIKQQIKDLRKDIKMQKRQYQTQKYNFQCYYGYQDQDQFNDQFKQGMAVIQNYSKNKKSQLTKQIKQQQNQIIQKQQKLVNIQQLKKSHKNQVVKQNSSINSVKAKIRYFQKQYKKYNKNNIYYNQIQQQSKLSRSSITKSKHPTCQDCGQYIANTIFASCLHHYHLNCLIKIKINDNKYFKCPACQLQIQKQDQKTEINYSKIKTSQKKQLKVKCQQCFEFDVVTQFKELSYDGNQMKQIRGYFCKECQNNRKKRKVVYQFDL